MDVITTFPTYALDYFHHINWLYAGIIAVVFGLVTARLPGIIIVPVFAAAAYIAALIVVPALLHHTAMAMPVFDKKLLEEGLAFYVFFLVADAVVYAVKSLIAKIFGW